MTATIISNAAPFGAATNQLVAGLYSADEAMERLRAAVATASSGYSGVPGTEFEDGTNFGVSADATTPGAKGKDYSFAVDTLATAWATFWGAAKGAIEQLDNGVRNP